MHVRSIIRLVDKYIGKPKAAVEIGVYRGETSAILCNKYPKCQFTFIDLWKVCAPDDSYAYDPMAKHTQDDWDKIFREARGNIHAASSDAIILMASSKQAVDFYQNGSLDFVFLDADHSYEAVSQDIRMWHRKVKTGGLLIGHDYGGFTDRIGRTGVKKAVDEFFGESNVIVKRGRIWAVRV